MPLDAVDETTTLQFVKGSHLWNQWCRPRYFATETNYLLDTDNPGFKPDRLFHDVPTKDIEAGKWPIIKWAVQVAVSSIACHLFICLSYISVKT